MYTVAVLLKFPDFHVTMMAAELAASTMQKLEACFCPSRRRQYRIGINQRRGVSSSTLRVLILRYNTHLPLNFGWLCNNTIMTIMTSLHTNPNQYPHVSIYIYIYKYKYPINYHFFNSLIFQNTRLLPSRYALLVPKTGRPRRGFQLRHGTTCS